jgi:hypothetical protein
MPSTCGSFPCSHTSPYVLTSGIQDGKPKGEQLAVHPSWQKSADKSTAFSGAKQWWRRWVTRPCDRLFTVAVPVQVAYGRKKLLALDRRLRPRASCDRLLNARYFFHGKSLIDTTTIGVV